MQLLDIETTAARLSLHPETVRRLIRAGELQAIKVGRVFRVEETELTNYVARLKAAPQGATDGSS